MSVGMDSWKRERNVTMPIGPRVTLFSIMCNRREFSSDGEPSNCQLAAPCSEQRNPVRETQFAAKDERAVCTCNDGFFGTGVICDPGVCAENNSMSERQARQQKTGIAKIGQCTALQYETEFQRLQRIADVQTLHCVVMLSMRLLPQLRQATERVQT